MSILHGHKSHPLTFSGLPEALHHHSLNPRSSGGLTFGIAWRDSTETITAYGTMGQTISRYCSSIAHESQSINGAANGLIRAELQVFDLEGQPLFPSPVFTSYQIAIPIYLLIPTYFATLLLIWLVLITRLTRRMFLTQADGLKKFDALAWRMQSAATDAVSGKSPLRLLEYPPTCSP